MQRRTRVAAAITLAASSLLASPGVGVGADARSARVAAPGTVTGWVPYWLTGTASSPGPALAAIDGASAFGLSTEVMPFWFMATGPSTIALPNGATIANLSRVAQLARSKNLRIIPSVTDGTGALVMQGILDNPVTRTEHADRLVSLVMAGVDGIPFDGIDLDYEGFAFDDPKDAATRAKTRAAWLLFLQELGQKLRAQGKLLSVTVPPIWNDGAAGYTMYGTPGEMTAHADRLRLMVYDWSVGAPGPIAPMSWVESVIAYVKKTVPAAELTKVWLGVPQHGRNWARISGECPDVLQHPDGSRVVLSTTSVVAKNAYDLAATHGAAVAETTGTGGRLEGEKTFTYPVGTFSGQKTVTPAPPAYVPPTKVAPDVGTAAEAALKPALRLKPSSKDVTCTITRVVHFPDNASVLQRSAAAASAGLGGIVLWAYGYEPLDLWAALAAG